MKNLFALTIAGLFSLSAQAADLSHLDYEDYAESSTWPTDDQKFFGRSSMITSNDNLTELIYEDYAQSGHFPDHNSLYSASETQGIAAIQNRIEQEPTAAGPHSTGGDVLLYDLYGNDIHAQ